MTEQRKLTMVQAINLALMQEMERDDDVLVLQAGGRSRFAHEPASRVLARRQ